jgi:hypothetical protein
MTIPIQNQPALATTARRYALLSVGAAVVTIALKSTAYGLTGSVGLLSDAIESVVNLVAALVAVWALTLAGRPADREHAYGHTKAEYIEYQIRARLPNTTVFTHLEPAEDRLSWADQLLDRDATHEQPSKRARPCPFPIC